MADVKLRPDIPQLSAILPQLRYSLETDLFAKQISKIEYRTGAVDAIIADVEAITRRAIKSLEPENSAIDDVQDEILLTTIVALESLMRKAFEVTDYAGAIRLLERAIAASIRLNTPLRSVIDRLEDSYIKILERVDPLPPERTRFGSPIAAKPTASKPSSGCFIATAAFGSPLDPKVAILREFRDRVLRRSRPGVIFINVYSKYSPPLAAYIEQREGIRTLIRMLLTPVVSVVARVNTVKASALTKN